MAKPGDILICIDDTFKPEILVDIINQAKGHPVMFPTKGKQYIVNEVFKNDVIGEESYTFLNMINPKFKIPLTGELRELSFANWRFKLVGKYVDR